MLAYAHMSERHGSLHPNGLILNVSHMSVCTVHETTGSRLLIDYYHSPFRQNLNDIVVFLRWNRSRGSLQAGAKGYYCISSDIERHCAIPSDPARSGAIPAIRSEAAPVIPTSLKLKEAR
jgi:hypothetical protein